MNMYGISTVMWKVMAQEDKLEKYIEPTTMSLRVVSYLDMILAAAEGLVY